MKSTKSKKQRRNIGDIVKIDLGKGYHSYGIVLNDPLMAFYDIRTKENLDINAISEIPVLFMVWVMNYAITDGDWEVIGNVPLGKFSGVNPAFFKKDIITKEYSIIYSNSSDDMPASKEDCELLECAAVWNPEHIVDRINDKFDGKTNIWVESLRR